MNRKSALSTLWIFLVLNYLYCDVMSLMDSNLLKQYLTGTVNGVEMNEFFLLGAAVLMEISIVMVLLSKVLKRKNNRIANIFAGSLFTLVQSATLFMVTPALYYLFCSVIEISTSAFIVWYAWQWKLEIN